MAEITVTDAQGLPDKSYLSFRVGDVRRQMQFKPGSKFRFDGDAPPRHFVVDVFEKVGTTQVSLADLADTATGITEGSIEVIRTNGASMNLNLKVTGPNGKNPKPLPAAPEVLSETVKPFAQTGTTSGFGQTGTTSGFAQTVNTSGDEVKETKKALRHQAAMKAKNYLDGHAVQKLLQGMVHNLLEKQPEDPLEFMTTYLQGKRVGLPLKQDKPAMTMVEDVQEVPLPDWSSQPGLGNLDTPGFASDGSDPLPNLSKHSNIMAKVLREKPSLYDNLRDVRTLNGVSLAKCIKTGVDNRGHQMIRVMGIVAGDEDCYDVFRDMFEPMVNLWHGDYPSEAMQPRDLDPLKVTNSAIDPDGSYVTSVQVRAVRNVHGLRFLPACSREERREAERLLVGALQKSDKGSYYPLRGSFSYVPKPGGMSDDEQRFLSEEQLLFDEPDSAVLLSSGIGRHWPDSRGIFHSDSEGLTVWINESDHAKIMVRRRDASLKEAFKTFSTAEFKMKAHLKQAGLDYARSEHFGFLSTCPSQLGTGMTCAVHIKLPCLSIHREFKQFCQHLGLHAHVHVGDREPGGDLQMGVWEVSGIERLGTSEVDQINTVIEGCRMLIQLEKSLEDGAEISFQDMVDAQAAEAETGYDDVQAADEDWDDYGSEEEWGLGDKEYPGFPTDECPDEMPDLTHHHSTMADILQEKPSIYHRLKNCKTTLGVSLAKCIKTGVDNQGHPMIKTVGMYAGDAECYEVFRELFDPVVAAKHPNFDITMAKHVTDMDYTKVTNEMIDPSGQRVLAVKARLSRNISGLRMPTACSKDERRQVESTVVTALSELNGDLQGEYFPIQGSCSYFAKPEGMSAEDEEWLQRQNVVFAEPDSEVQLSSGFGRSWPDARGVWLSENGKLVVRINEEDHVRMLYTQNGQDLKEVFARLCRAHAAIQDSMELSGYRFAHNQRLGYLAVCPSNAGSCLIVSVTLKLPLVGAQPEFRETCKQLGVVARWGSFVGVSKSEGVHDISNAERLGTSEVQQVERVILACRFFLELEERMENGEEIRWEDAFQRVSLTKDDPEPAPFDWDAQLKEWQNELERLGLPREINFSHIPGLGSEEYPGFPADICPAQLPDLSRHFSLMSDVLKGDPSIYLELKDVRTRMGVPLAKCIKTGVDNAGHPMIKTVGAVAGDAESYDTFRKLFDPVIKVMHRGSRYAEDGHQTDLDDMKVSSEPLDPVGRYVLAVRVRTQRNLASLRMLPACSREERREAERVIWKALQELSGEFSGEYFPLRGSTSHSPKPWGMTKEEEQALEQDGLLFHEPDAALILSSGTGRDWPEARGVFLCESSAQSQKLAAWINEEDHLRLLVTRPGSDLKAAFSCLSTTERVVRDAIRQEGYDYAWNERLGFLSACPSNLGTGLRAEVTCALPLLSTQQGFKQLGRRMKLQVRAAAGEWGPAAGAFDIGNIEKLGSSEVSQVNFVMEGVRLLVDLESRLESGEEFDLTAVQVPLRS